MNNWLDVLGLGAADWQGKGKYPGVDQWETVTLEKGTIVYGGVPGQSEFYLSKESLDASGGSKEALWKSAQVEAHPEFGYRSQVQGYMLLEDIEVETSITKANPQFGEGGARQYYVEDYKNKVKAIGDPINLH